MASTSSSSSCSLSLSLPLSLSLCSDVATTCRRLLASRGALVEGPVTGGGEGDGDNRRLECNGWVLDEAVDGIAVVCEDSD